LGLILSVSQYQTFFVVDYGIDYAHEYRHLPFIANIV